MKTIKFKNDDKPYNVMVKDERFMICSRVYTIQESKEVQSQYDKNFNEYMSNCYKEYSNYEPNKYKDEDDYLDNSSNAENCRSEYIYTHGEQPEIFKEDSQYYTIVDKKLKIRGADNYYNKFNYLDMDECKQALKELHNGDMEISRRNRIDLDIEN